MRKYLAFLLLTAGVAQADGIDCPHPPRKPHKHVTPLPKPCDCPPGAKGEQGLQGPPGVAGKSGTSIAVWYDDTNLRIKLGVTGSVFGEYQDWAWGPALQLAQRTGFAAKGEIVVDAGLAMVADGATWSPGREAGVLLHAGYARDMSKHFAWTLGVHDTAISGSASNGQISGNYFGTTGGVVLRAGSVRAELGVVVPLNTLDVGLTGSAFYGF